MNARSIAVLEVFILLIALCNAILPGYGDGRMQPITDNPVFGCQWLGGGLGAALQCTCFPEAELMDIQKNSIPSMDLTTISIRNCERVHFGEDAVADMRSLRNVNIDNIVNLTLGQRSLHWEGYTTINDLNTPFLRVNIRSSNIEEISSYTFMGRIGNITFDRVTIKSIAPFAFNSLSQCQGIAFVESNVVNISPQAFKKFSADTLLIDSSVIENLPSRSFSDLIVTDSLIISNSHLVTVNSGAFLIHNPRRFEITNTNFTRLEGEGFRITTRGDVIFKNCNFNTSYDGVFEGISLNLREVPARKLLVLDSLNFQEVSTSTLRINSTSFDPKFVNILIQRPCSCRQFFLLENTYQTQELFCIHNGSRMSYHDFNASNCSTLASNATLIIIICTALILLLIIGTIMWCYFKKLYKCDRYGEEKNDKAGKLSMIVPDGRTYRETELHVIVERTDLLTTDL